MSCVSVVKGVERISLNRKHLLKHLLSALLLTMFIKNQLSLLTPCYNRSLIILRNITSPQLQREDGGAV